MVKKKMVVAASFNGRFFSSMGNMGLVSLEGEMNESK